MNGSNPGGALPVRTQSWGTVTYGPCLTLASGSGSPSYSGSIPATSGSANLNANVNFNFQVYACFTFTIDWVPWDLSFTPNYVEFYESYSETLSATLTAGSSGFSENNFNSQPLQIAGGPVAEWTFYDVLTLSINLYLAAEYDFSLTGNSWVTLNQGTSGWADQNYSFATGQWTDTDSPIACASGGESVSTGCVALTTSNPFGGEASIRLGPEASLTLAVGSLPVIGSLGSVSGWVFIYGQLTAFYGVGPSTSGDLSGGQCGSNYIILGVSSGAPAVSQPWFVVCWEVGIQFGASWSAVFGLFSGPIAVSPAYTLWAGPVATTVDICDLTQEICTATLTNTDPVQPAPSWTMGTGETDELTAYMPLQVAPYTYASVGGTWATPVSVPNLVTIGGSPPCGSITDIQPDPQVTVPTGSWADYQAPNVVGICQLTFSTGLFFGVSVPSFQINSVTLDIQVVAPLVIVPYPIHIGPLGCFPIIYCLGPLPDADWSIKLLGSGNQTYSATNLGNLTVAGVPNGTYSYTITPPPGVTPINGTSGSLTVSGKALYLSEDFVRQTLSFTESGLPSGTRWSVYIDGETLNSTSETLAFDATPGKITYRVDNVPGYYVTPSNTSSVTLNGADVSVPVHFVTNKTSSPSLPVSYPVEFVPSLHPLGEDGAKAFVSPVEVTISVTVFPGITENGTDPTFQLPNGTYTYAVESLAQRAGILTTDSGSGTVTVDGSAVSESITYTPKPYQVTLAAIGLPLGTSWTASVENTATKNTTTNTSTGPSMVFVLGDGIYNYSIQPITDYAGKLTGSIHVNGSSTGATVYFLPELYPVIVQESGLPLGTLFTASTDGMPLSTTVSGAVTALTWMEFNGTYRVTEPIPTGWNGILPPSGDLVHVAGATALYNVTFVPASRPYHTVTFKETGLPANNTSWSVVVDNETIDSLSNKALFSLEAGTYSYTIVGESTGFAPVHASGTFTVHGKGQTVAVKFKPIPYTVTFTESGLPPGHAWSVKIPHFGSKSSHTDEIVFHLPTGMYAFAVGTVKGYTSSGPAEVTVPNGPTSVAVTFAEEAGVSEAPEAGARTPATVGFSGTTFGPLHGIGVLGLATFLLVRRSRRRQQ